MSPLQLRIFDNAYYMVQEKINWAKCDMERVRCTRDSTTWSFSSSDDDIEGMWNEFHAKVTMITNCCVPKITKKCTAEGFPIKRVPWECSVLRRSRKVKDKSWRIFECNPSNDSLRKAMDAQRAFEIKEQDSKRNYEQRLASNLKINPKMFYSYLRSKRKVNKSIGSVINPINGERTENASDTAQVFVKYFSSVF